MTQAHAQRAHARFSPSGADRWVKCPGSITLSAGMPDSTSSYAEEGTVAHQLAEWCLRKNLDPGKFIGMWVDPKSMVQTRGDAPGAVEITEEMADAVRAYVYWLQPRMDPPFEFEIEQKIDLTSVAADLWGTGDAVIYDPTKKHLWVADFKYGKGKAVDAIENPQLLTYALGAAKRFHNRGVEQITIVIIQPRAYHPSGAIVRPYEVDLLEVFGWQARLKKAVADALSDSPTFSAGDHCRWCKAAPKCPTLRAQAFETAMLEFSPVEDAKPVPPDELSPEAVAHALRQADILETWAKAVRDWAFAEAMRGNPPAGTKLVWKRPTRRWKDEGAAVRALVAAGFDQDTIMTDPKLKSPAQVEGALGKSVKIKEVLAPLIDSTSSGLTLVDESDKREAAKPSAASEFAAIEM